MGKGDVKSENGTCELEDDIEEWSKLDSQVFTTPPTSDRARNISPNISFNVTFLERWVQSGT